MGGKREGNGGPKRRRPRGRGDPEWKPIRRGKGPMQLMMQACRLAVQDQIQECSNHFFQEETIEATCPVLGLPLTRENSHVHHAGTPFVDLVRHFCTIEGYVPRKGHFSLGCFVDVSMQERFAAYHKQHATLKIVHAQANLSTLKRSTVCPFLPAPVVKPQPYPRASAPLHGNGGSY